jgi:aminoglycoside/choline kinase family phosphotransferase
MTPREMIIQKFLKTQGFDKAVRQKMGSDASFRSYERLSMGGKTYILMDAPPPKEDVRPFIKVCDYLYKMGLSSPEIMAEDVKNGLLLLEDFGDARYNVYLKEHPEQEELLYTKAVEVLAKLHKHPPLDVPPYDEALLIEHAERFLEWYVPHVLQREVPREGFVAAWKEVLKKRDAGKPVVALFDFHADNLMWLPDEKVGLLDFQDALLAPPTYDLVSLLQDCRRPVSLAFEKKMLAHYKSLSGLDLDASYAIMGAQRHTRILGTFVRLAVRDQKPHYLEWVPQEWRYLKQNLAHPVLRPLKKWFDDNGF